MLLIVSDTYSIALQYAREQGLGRRDWLYVPTLQQAYGRRGPGRYVRIYAGVGTAAQLSERLEVADYLKSVGFEPL